MATNGIVAFVIGLGPYVSGYDETGNPIYPPINADNTLPVLDPDTRPPRDASGGMRLLRYIADMGFDPDEEIGNKKWPCHSDYWAGAAELGYQTQCGNYWYAPTGQQLEGVFEEIASRMFTRLSQ
jgi:hypothetical protein